MLLGTKPIHSPVNKKVHLPSSEEQDIEINFQKKDEKFKEIEYENPLFHQLERISNGSEEKKIENQIKRDVILNKV